MGKEALTLREREVLQLVGYLRSRDIARLLAISELTVRKHRANICMKLGLGSTAALIAHAAFEHSSSSPSGSAVSGLGTLTHRENEIVQALAFGQTSKHIARQLGISPRTVEKHRENCMRKLGVHNMTELLTRLPRNGPATVYSNVRNGEY